ncbi:hypothetical protein K9L67_04555 [Candidatus Woesearchaeota archaeon]|nr:hypothetical protein [Candidatus Woesearchaeota archaeon]MCF7901470.1 hypothetical protein [Candidatus Woesearchaeota archaeon]MCF8013197.1 hypothetical protein [Candidatus Woesearchaeota archaeon]
MFIEINERIFDQEVIQRQAILLKNIIMYECSEVLKKYGFNEKNELFENEELALSANIVFKELFLNK